VSAGTGVLAAALAVVLLAVPAAVRAQAEVETGWDRSAELGAVRPPPPRIEPGTLLPDVDPGAPMTPERARALQQAVGETRQDAADAFVRERIDCYRRLLVNRCLGDVDARARAATARLDAIEVGANRTLREAGALELNRRAAASIDARAADAPAESARREENRRAFEARLAAAQAERARREADAPELERRASANRAERERREAQNAQRRAEAEQRATQDAANAEARTREVERQRVQAAEREATEAQRAAGRRAEAQRRLEQAERRSAQPPASSRLKSATPSAAP
jgi:hypothetical protein